MAFHWRDHSAREQLPIDDYLGNIVHLLGENQVIIVEAETGAGKSTRIPQALLLETPHEITVTQPRRPAVRWIAKRVAWEMNEEPGNLVGWKLYGEDPVWSENTRCLFRVDQSLANWIRRYDRLPDGVIIVDEAHERHISTDALLIMLKRLLPTSPNTKLLITSATIDTEKFSKYFWDAPVLKIQGRCYPVETKMQELFLGEHHTEGAIRAAKNVIESFLDGELTIQSKEVEDERVLVEKGTILVFLPGEEDIRNAVSELEGLVEALREQLYSVRSVTFEKEEAWRKGEEQEEEGGLYTIEIFPCHGRLSPAELDRTQGVEIPENTLRVVCTTDIARTSATFPEVVGVIDSLQIKRPFVDARGVAHLDKISVSRAEADQAKGRAGRTQPGFYIPISFYVEFMRLDLWPMPAILREPLTSVVLQFIDAGINPRECEYIDNPGIQKIAAAIERLKKLEALDDDENITEIGKLLVKFPLDPERAKMLITAESYGVLSEAIIAAACMEQENIFWTPKPNFKVLIEEYEFVNRIINLYQEVHDEYLDPIYLPSFVIKKGKFWEIDCSEYDRWNNYPIPFGARAIATMVRSQFTKTGSDFELMVNAFRAFKQVETKLRAQYEGHEKQRKMVEKGLAGWCKRHFLEYKKLRAVQHTVRMIIEEVKSSPLKYDNNVYEPREFDSNALSKAIASGLIDNIGVRPPYLDSFISPLGNFVVSHSSSCPKEKEKLVLVGGVKKISAGGKRYFLMAESASPFRPEWLLEVLPGFCEIEPDENEALEFDASRDMAVLVGTIRFNNTLFFGVPIPARDHPQAGRAFAEAFFRGEIEGSQKLLSFNKANREKREELHNRGFKIDRFSEKDEQDLYAQAFEAKGIRSSMDLRQALTDRKIMAVDLAFPAIPKESDLETRQVGGKFTSFGELAKSLSE